MPTEQYLLAGIEAHPEDLDRRAVYADWLEEQSDPRAAYVRLGCETLSPDTPDARRRESKKSARRLANGLDARWVRSIEAQDNLYLISQRLKTPVSVTLRVLWREAALASDLIDED